MNNNIQIRKKLLSNCRRVVVKVGTRLLTDEKMIPGLIAQLVKLREKGWKVLLVSSGAVGIGMKLLETGKRPARLSAVQALASVGQGRLMALYEIACREHGFHAAQLLLTADDLRDRERHLNVLNCINALWSQDILPIVNENDAVSVDELKFGDNDVLAGLLAAMTRSDLTMLLTTVDGLWERDESGKLSERISVVKNIDDKLKGNAAGTDDKAFSIGGMESKIRAAEIVTAAGEPLWIADGRVSGIVEKILNAEDVGSVFLPKSGRMQGKKRWIKFFSRRSGKIIVDAGAAKALAQGGRSLLPSGVTGVEGDFKRGDTVEICGLAGNVIARGLVNFDAGECRKIMGKQSSEIPEILRHDADDEIVHRNNMAVLKGVE